MFYTFKQNNSGGSWSFDEKNGITIYVIIEAPNHYEANRKAEEIGLYFDGVDKGMDCPCCGDRWYKADSLDGDNKPKIYNTIIKSQFLPYFVTSWLVHGKEGIIHFSNGKKEWLYISKKEK